MILSFGKYAGRELQDVPRSYLRWLLRSSRQLVAAIEEELEEYPDTRRLSAPPIEELPAISRELIEAGYRAMLLKRHPDAGGDHEAAVELNLAMEQLRKVFEVRTCS